jgi:predicted ATPase
VEFSLQIKNYRCFPDSSPLRFVVKPGFTSFVGVNNVGKSTILKSVYELRSIFYALGNEYNDLVGMIAGKQTRGFDPSPGLFDREEIFNDSNERPLEIVIEIPRDATPSFPQPSRAIVTLSRPTSSWTVRVFADNDPLVFATDHYFKESILMERNRNRPVADFAHFFAVFRTLQQAMFVGAFRHVIPFKAATPISSSQAFPQGTNYFDLIIGQDFVDAFSSHQTGSRQQSRGIAALIDDLANVFELPNLRLVSAPSRQTFQVSIEGASYKLSELGSGFTQFLVVLGNALIRKPSYIFIDEPELHLHPTLQQKFVMLLGKYSAHGVVFTTHSYGLARSASDSVFTIRRSDGRRELQPLGQTSLPEFLGELNFSGYQELGFDKLLLVEGPTDLRCMHEFLRKLKRDHEFVVVHLGGGSSINGKCSAQLADLNASPPKSLLLLIVNARQQMLRWRKMYASSTKRARSMTFHAKFSSVGH